MFNVAILLLTTVILLHALRQTPKKEGARRLSVALGILAAIFTLLWSLNGRSLSRFPDMIVLSLIYGIGAYGLARLIIHLVGWVMNGFAEDRVSNRS